MNPFAWLLQFFLYIAGDNGILFVVSLFFGACVLFPALVLLKDKRYRLAVWKRLKYVGAVGSIYALYAAMMISRRDFVFKYADKAFLPVLGFVLAYQVERLLLTMAGLLYPGLILLIGAPFSGFFAGVLLLALFFLPYSHVREPGHAPLEWVFLLFVVLFLVSFGLGTWNFWRKRKAERVTGGLSENEEGRWD